MGASRRSVLPPLFYRSIANSLFLISAHVFHGIQRKQKRHSSLRELKQLRNESSKSHHEVAGADEGADEDEVGPAAEVAATVEDAVEDEEAEVDAGETAIANAKSRNLPNKASLKERQKIIQRLPEKLVRNGNEV